jgi:hypothetical protein
MKLNDAGTSNGLIEMWIDGHLEASRTGLNWVGSYSAYGINMVFFENYWNNGSPVAQDRFFDNLVISTRPIGLVASGGSTTSGSTTSGSGTSGSTTSGSGTSGSTTGGSTTGTTPPLGGGGGKAKSCGLGAMTGLGLALTLALRRRR